MVSAAAIPATERGTAPVVCTCYDLLDIALLCGVADLTDGKYVDERNDDVAYRQAQIRQAEYLLNQACCGPGTRLLDIGCGYGRILAHAARRGATAVGITISPQQVAYCRARGLDARELNYRDIFSATNAPLALPYEGEGVLWEHAFNAIVANGSLEHFVQAADAAAGHADEVYDEMFAICRRLVVKDGRFVTTAIHFRQVGQFDPAEILRGSVAHPQGSAAYQYAVLTETFGGWYPEPGQLERCAAEHFELIGEEDGTHDYHLTSEYWLRRLKWSLAASPRVWWKLAGTLAHHPRAAWRMLRGHLWDQAWYWQFRPPAPMRLLRQSWRAK